MKRKKMQLEEVTPAKFRCIIGSCPSIFKTNRKTYIVVGKKIANVDSMDELSRKIGPDEMAVELPEGILVGLLKNGAK